MNRAANPTARQHPLWAALALTAPWTTSLSPAQTSTLRRKLTLDPAECHLNCATQAIARRHSRGRLTGGLKVLKAPADIVAIDPNTTATVGQAAAAKHTPSILAHKVLATGVQRRPFLPRWHTVRYQDIRPHVDPFGRRIVTAPSAHRTTARSAGIRRRNARR
jgi:hypothetical protein